MIGSRKPRLLIVDDDAVILTMLGEYFTDAGFAVTTAPDVPTALAEFDKGCDVVLSDIGMPEVTGVEFLQRARQANPKLGVFLITGQATLATVIDAKRHGAIAYFRKPLNLPEVEARLRAHLGDDAKSLIDGHVLIVGEELLGRLAERLVRFRTLSCTPEEAVFLRVVAERRPVVVLAAAGAPQTGALLRAYKRLGRDANSFLVVSGEQEQEIDAATEMLFAQGAVGCVAADAKREVIEWSICTAVQDRETATLDAPEHEGSHRCPFAAPYRNGYYCLKQDGCPYGPFQAGWIGLEGKEHVKCDRRPLLVNDLAEVGFETWTGRAGPRDAIELRKRLLRLVRARRKEIVIDAQGLTDAHYNLFEMLSDAGVELLERTPDGLIHVINLTDAMQDAFRKAVTHKSVRFYGFRMVDEQSTFARWGSRFV
jgi:DNA-binding response OmpR family regulator